MDFLFLLLFVLFLALYLRLFIFLYKRELIIAACHSIEHAVRCAVDVVDSEPVNFCTGVNCFAGADPLFVWILSFDKVFDIVQALKIDVEGIFGIDFLKDYVKLKVSLPCLKSARLLLG